MRTKTTCSIYDVFTPSTPASLTFVERSSISNKLDRALKTKGKQIIIYGHSGTGKTTLIHNYISNYYENKITTRCSKGTTIEDIIFDAFNQLDLYYKDSIETSEGSKIGGGLSANFLGIKASLNSELQSTGKETLKKIIAVQLTPSTLAKFIGQAKCCWIIEDFHKVITKDKDRLAQIMKIFMDTAIDFPELKIITIGAVNTAREVIQYDKEMKNRVAEINVSLMDYERLAHLIEKGENYLNIKFDPSVIEKVITFACGLPAVVHNLCLLMCQQKNLGDREKNDKLVSFNKSDFKNAVDEFIKENEDTYKAIFEKATYSKYNRQYENPKELLYCIISSPNDEVTITEITSRLKLQHPGYRSNNLRQYLDELTETDRDEVLRYHKATNSYHFSNPFFKSYVAAKQFEELQKITLSKRNIIKKMSNYLEELNLSRMAFLRDFEEMDDEFTSFYDEQTDEEDE